MTSGSIAPATMLGVSLDSLWTPDHNVMDEDLEIRSRKRNILFLENKKNAGRIPPTYGLLYENLISFGSALGTLLNFSESLILIEKWNPSKPERAPKG